MCFSTGKQMCFSTGKQCSLRKHLYILLGSSGHSVQRTSDDGHQYILLSCLGNSVILSKGRQAMVISIFCCPVWETASFCPKDVRRWSSVYFEVFYFFPRCVLHGGVLFLSPMRVARRCSVSFPDACCTVFYFFSPMRVARRCSISFPDACCTVFYFFSPMRVARRCSISFPRCVLHGGVLFLFPDACCTVFYFFSRCVLHGVLFLFPDACCTEVFYFFPRSRCVISRSRQKGQDGSCVVAFSH